MKYAIVAVNSIGLVSYLCSSATQGERFVPNAQSMAMTFENGTEANDKAQALSKQYKGLKISAELMSESL